MPHIGHIPILLCQRTVTVIRQGASTRKICKHEPFVVYSYHHIIKARLHQTLLGLAMFSHPHPILWRFWTTTTTTTTTPPPPPPPPPGPRRHVLPLQVMNWPPIVPVEVPYLELSSQWSTSPKKRWTGPHLEEFSVRVRGVPRILLDHFLVALEVKTCRIFCSLNSKIHGNFWLKNNYCDKIIFQIFQVARCWLAWGKQGCFSLSLSLSENKVQIATPTFLQKIYPKTCHNRSNTNELHQIEVLPTGLFVIQWVNHLRLWITDMVT